MSLSAQHKKAISEGLLKYHRRFGKAISEKLSSMHKRHAANREVRRKSKELDKLYLGLRKHAPGSDGHVPHLEKINKTARELRRLKAKHKK